MAAAEPQAPGWRAHRAPGLRARVMPAYEAALRAERLLEPGGLARALAQARPLARGREPVYVLELAPRPVVVRRLRHGGWLGPLLGGAYWGSGRALEELRVTAALHAAGAPVAEPAFALATRRGGPLWEAAVATVLEPDALDALAWLAEARPPEERLRAAAAAGSAVRRFHDAGGRHADLQIKNLLVRVRDGRLDVLLIDLDRARRVAEVDPATRMAELMRLYRSLRKRALLDPVGARGLARFFAAYCRGDRALRRALRASLPAELRRIERHARLWRQQADAG